MSRITLENLHLASRQEIFSQVATHLLTQNKKSLEAHEFGYGICMYRDDNGLSCAAGCLISEEQYAKIKEKTDIENSTWPSVITIIAAMFPKACEHEQLIIDLQQVHDQYVEKNWRQQLVMLAFKNGLKMPTIEAHT